MNNCVKAGILLALGGILIWLVLLWRSVHPIWIPLQTAFPLQFPATILTNFYANTYGSYIILVRCKRSGLSAESAAHFEDWRVPGKIPCDVALQVQSGTESLLKVEVRELVPYSSTRDYFFYSLADVDLPKSGQFVLTLRYNGGLQSLQLADPLVLVRLSPELLKSRMLSEAIGRFAAIALGVLGGALALVGFLFRCRKRDPEIPLGSEA